MPSIRTLQILKVKCTEKYIDKAQNMYFKLKNSNKMMEKFFLQLAFLKHFFTFQILSCNHTFAIGTVEVLLGATNVASLNFKTHCFTY